MKMKSYYHICYHIHITMIILNTIWFKQYRAQYSSTASPLKWKSLEDQLQESCRTPTLDVSDLHMPTFLENECGFSDSLKLNAHMPVHKKVQKYLSWEEILRFHVLRAVSAPNFKAGIYRKARTTGVSSRNSWIVFFLKKA